MAYERMDSGLQGLPEPVQKALHFAVQRAAETCVLRQGQTPLYWHLVAIVNEHRKELELDKPPKPE